MSDAPPVNRSRLARVAVPLLAGLALAGCAAPAIPGVSVYSSREMVRIDPVQHCDVQLTECQDDESAVGVLEVPPGAPVQISVPVEVSETPWQVAFRYRLDGEVIDARSEVFAPHERLAYTLRLPDDSAQLEALEVQQFGAALVQDQNGVGFVTRGIWVLSVDDRDSLDS
ncbi:DUF2771 family protein [Actinoalloteichus hymeniacidonis]|uniref:DUF2771 family protein n=1 Tax=Actinoalloteichus hymeniacidonis TaxID=340345 RepID=A0AAC9HUH5_9PSEU|nr:DUF2771 family protein [Actinoalloteichus hymeniacidonis]AOS65824.1 putative DUF2771 family protein [Actinoalloteichus hymeniacidonis]MBB5906085.1 hypothetical protein [Actinoalloteichus hymeniacidonis]